MSLPLGRPARILLADDLAQQAKAGCVISRALAVPVQLQATLEAG